jgi:hypothetical protein
MELQGLEKRGGDEGPAPDFELLNGSLRDPYFPPILAVLID